MRLTSGGILLIDKPRGWTSFDVVAKLRGVLGIRKIGHTGTLDPFADGLLAVCFGRATRLIQYMEAHDKTYRVTVAFGRTTDTLDLTGQTTAVNPLTETERADLLANGFAPVQRAVAALTGITAQVPPLYSAVKSMAGRCTDMPARAGRSIAIPARYALTKPSWSTLSCSNTCRLSSASAVRKAPTSAAYAKPLAKRPAGARMRTRCAGSEPDPGVTARPWNPVSWPNVWPAALPFTAGSPGVSQNTCWSRRQTPCLTGRSLI